MADTATLRGAIYSALESNEDFGTLPFSALRQDLERNLGLPHQSLKHQKSEIMDLVVEYNYMLEQKKKDNQSQETAESSGMKSGKYSKQETTLILDTIHDYLDVNGYDISDVCYTFREEGQKTQHHSELWRSLADLLPHRRYYDIKMHAVCKLSGTLKHGKWTKEEKELLNALVLKHGPLWTKIGRELNRYGVDCKDVYKIMQPRVKSGRYSPDEESRLVVAIRKACECPDTIPVQMMPSKGISWKAVASNMNNERLPLDYQRKWISLRSNICSPIKVKTKTRSSEKDSQDPVTVNSARSDHIDRQIIAYVAHREPEDETDITWSQIDREFLLNRSAARARWIAMCNKAFLGASHSMEKKIETLMEMYGMDDEDVETLSTATAPVVMYDGPAAPSRDFTALKKAQGETGRRKKKRIKREVDVLEEIPEEGNREDDNSADGDDHGADTGLQWARGSTAENVASKHVGAEDSFSSNADNDSSTIGAIAKISSSKRIKSERNVEIVGEKSSSHDGHNHKDGKKKKKKDKSRDNSKENEKGENVFAAPVVVIQEEDMVSENLKVLAEETSREKKNSKKKKRKRADLANSGNGGLLNCSEEQKSVKNKKKKHKHKHHDQNEAENETVARREMAHGAKKHKKKHKHRKEKDMTLN